MNLLTINGMKKAYTDKNVFCDAAFSVLEGEKIGVIGYNGCGKSTLLKIIAGIEEMDAGEYAKGNNVYIKYLPQNMDVDEDITVYEYVIKDNKSHLDSWQIEGEVKSVLNKLGIDEYDKKLSLLSGGQKKRVALAAAITTPCDILILDEPTNHLDNDMIVWLEQYLNARNGAIVMVTHDRYFLDRVTNRIVEIDGCKMYSYNGHYETYLYEKAQRLETIEAANRKRNTVLRSELAWMRRGAQARSTKQKARIERFEELSEAKTEAPREKVAISSLSSRLGKKTIEICDICKGYDDKQVISHFSYNFLRDDRLGIVGPNGCGKSTLIKLIVDSIKPDSGYIERGETVRIGYFSQENEYMDEEIRPIDYIKETAEYIDTVDGKVTASKMLERFLFDSTLSYQYIKKLSGGEKRRLYLLKVLMESPNVLILDEPTNDLDIETLAILEDYLESFDGIIITVSHDRFFLDRIVNRVFAFENGEINQYEGNFSDYLVARNSQSLYNGNVSKSKDKFNNQDDGTSKDSVKNKKPRLSQTKLKMTYNEQKEYDTIDEDITNLESKISKLEEDITNNSTDFAKLTEFSKEKEETESLLELKLERWEYLSELAERIERENQQG